MRWNYSRTVLTLCMLAFFVTMVGRLVISPLVPLITEDFEITNAAIGSALSLMWLAYALAQFPSGILADKYGEKRIILLAVGGTAVMSVLIVVSPVFSFFFVGVVALGAVAGLHYTVATALLSRTFDDIGTAIGFHSLGSPLAGLIAPVAAAWIGFRYGWRVGVALTICVAIPVFILFVLSVRRETPQRPDEPLRQRLQPTEILDLFGRPAVIFTVGISVLTGFVAQGVFSFLPAFLVEHHGYSTALAGVVFSGFFVVKSGGQVGVGAISDRYGRDGALAGCMLVGIVGIALLIDGSHRIVMIGGVVLLGLGMSYAAAVHARFMDQFSPDEFGSGFGLVRTVYGILAAAGSVTVGYLADSFGWAVAFGTLIGLLGLVIIAVGANRLFRLGL